MLLHDTQYLLHYKYLTYSIMQCFITPQVVIVSKNSVKCNSLNIITLCTQFYYFFWENYYIMNITFDLLHYMQLLHYEML